MISSDDLSLKLRILNWILVLNRRSVLAIILFLGAFDSIENAAEARKEAEEILFDGVAEHYRKWTERAELEPAWAAETPFQVNVSQMDKKLTVTLLPNL